MYKLLMLALLILSFAAGGVIGTAGYLAIGYWIVVPTASLLLALTLGPILAQPSDTRAG